MERLTKRYGKGIVRNDDSFIFCSNYCDNCGKADCETVQKMIRKLADYEDLEEQGGKTERWIPVSEKLPENEKDVEITYTKKHWKTGEMLYFTARAFYTDGTMTTEDSFFNWDLDNDFEYNEEKDSYIIPEGWWESVSFGEEFAPIDVEVIAWRPLSEPYKP